MSHLNITELMMMPSKLVYSLSSLRDKAKIWLNSLPQCSITTWNEFAQIFIVKYSPPPKIAKIINDITSFINLDNESI